MSKNPYEFSYSMRIKTQKKIIKIILYIILLFLLHWLISDFVLFSISSAIRRTPDEKVQRNLLLVTPLARPSFKDIPVLGVVLQPFRIDRGNLVYVLPQYGMELNWFTRLIDQVSGFVTFQQHYLFSDSAHITENATVRRVVAMPGDTVYMNNFVLYVKPAGESHFLTEYELTKIQYDAVLQELPPQWDTSLGAYGVFPETRLGDDEYFLLADDRMQMADSRLWGPVSSQRIGGRVFLCLWPFGKFSLL